MCFWVTVWYTVGGDSESFGWALGGLEVHIVSKGVASVSEGIKLLWAVFATGRKGRRLGWAGSQSWGKRCRPTCCSDTEIKSGNFENTCFSFSSAIPNNETKYLKLTKLTWSSSSLLWSLHWHQPALSPASESTLRPAATSASSFFQTAPAAHAGVAEPWVWEPAWGHLRRPTIHHDKWTSVKPSNWQSRTNRTRLYISERAYVLQWVLKLGDHVLTIVINWSHTKKSFTPLSITTVKQSFFF